MPTLDKTLHRAGGYRRRALCAAALLVLGCDTASGPGAGAVRDKPSRQDVPPPIAPPAPAQAEIPAAMRPCVLCHEAAVEAYLGHGMSRSIGAVGTPPTGTVTNPSTGQLYEISTGDGGAWLEAVAADGGWRRQRLVGRIGAGILDTSWVGMEVDGSTGAATGRLFFAPVEHITGHGLELSPFELAAPSAGLDFALTEDCLTCHTTTSLARLPGAAGAGTGGHLFPDNALGSDAFQHLSAITCADCHGDARRHLELMPVPEGGDVGLPRLSTLPPGQQRDVCARCHLQGDVRLDLAGQAPNRERPLAGQIPVLVSTGESDDYRFVSQSERLALSACFRATPSMTCTTCHEPHSGVARQGRASFDAACLDCHPCTSSGPARDGGCVDCHVRHSQPFDLPHVKSADHYIRRRPPPPRTDVAHRQFADPEGTLELFDDGRLAAVLATPEGVRWRSGVLAMGLMTMGRFDEASELFSLFAAPATPEALEPTAPADLLALENRPAFHQLRGMALMTAGRTEDALAAFGDALRLDPLLPGALMSRARLRFSSGNWTGALEDTQILIDAYPRAEHPWNLRAEIAERLGRPRLMTSALLASTEIWPSNASAWYRLGRGFEASHAAQSRQALERARLLSPSVFD